MDAFGNLPFTKPHRIGKHYSLDIGEQGLRDLGKLACDAAAFMFRKNGSCPIAAILFCERHPTRVVDPGGVFYVGMIKAETDKQKDQFAFAISVMAKMGAADAVAFVTEAWTSGKPAEYPQASKDPERKECLFVVVQTRLAERVHMGAITRYQGRGASIAWEAMPPEVTMEGRFANLLKRDLPPEVQVMCETIAALEPRGARSGS